MPAVTINDKAVRNKVLEIQDKIIHEIRKKMSNLAARIHDGANIPALQKDIDKIGDDAFEASRITIDLEGLGGGLWCSTKKMMREYGMLVELYMDAGGLKH